MMAEKNPGALPAPFKILAQFAQKQEATTEKREDAAKTGQESAAGNLHASIRSLGL